ncbi:MAG: hypothetical protein ACJAYN_000143 [Bermanella sp.]|jgi:hypothetical protein
MLVIILRTTKNTFAQIIISAFGCSNQIDHLHMKDGRQHTYWGLGGFVIRCH